MPYPTRSVYWRKHPMKTATGEIVTRRGHHKNIKAIKSRKIGIISKKELKQSQLRKNRELLDKAPVEAIEGVGEVTAGELHDRNVDTVEDFEKFQLAIEDYNRNKTRRQQEIQLEIDDLTKKLKDVPRQERESEYNQKYRTKEQIEEQIARQQAFYTEQIEKKKVEQKYPFMRLGLGQTEADIEKLSKSNYPVRPGLEYEDFFWQFPEWMVGDVKFRYIDEEDLKSVQEASGGAIAKFGTVGAYYHPNSDTINIPPGDFKEDKIKLYHEFAHHVWYKEMNLEAMNEFEPLVKRLEKSQPPMPGGYDDLARLLIRDSETKSKEWFADTFAHYTNDRFHAVRNEIIKPGGYWGLETHSNSLARSRNDLDIFEEKQRRNNIPKAKYSRSSEYRKIRKEIRSNQEYVDKINSKLAVIPELERYYDNLMRKEGKFHKKSFS